MTKIDLNATLVPGKRAAGIELGTPIKLVLKDNHVESAEHIEEYAVYHFSFVTVFVKDEVVHEIEVHAGAGKLRQNSMVGVGTNIHDIVAVFGGMDINAIMLANIRDIPGCPGVMMVFNEAEFAQHLCIESLVIQRVDEKNMFNNNKKSLDEIKVGDDIAVYASEDGQGYAWYQFRATKTFTDVIVAGNIAFSRKTGKAITHHHKYPTIFPLGCRLAPHYDQTFADVVRSHSRPQTDIHDIEEYGQAWRTM